MYTLAATEPELNIAELVLTYVCVWLCAATGELCQEERGVTQSKYGNETTTVGTNRMRGPHLLILYFHYVLLL